MRLPCCTKGHDIISWGASQDACRIIVSKAIGSRANLLKTLRIVCWTTCRRIIKLPCATVLAGVEHVAGAPTRHHLPVLLRRQLWRAVVPQVPVAPRRAAVSFPARRLYRYRKVEAVHKADIVVIYGAKGKVGKGGRPASRAGAVQHFSAPTSLALPIAIIVKVATGSTPYPTGPRIRGGVDGRFTRF